jgi:hypothetical protein
MPGLRRLEAVAAEAPGRLLSTVIRGLAAVRPARKPLHPRGTVLRGRLDRHGSDEPSGVSWLDEVGSADVLARLSQAIGLPTWLPDIQGLALRIDPGGRPADVLLATTGHGRLTRFLLTPSRNLSRAMTTLLPYRTPAGPVLLGAERTDDIAFALSWARVSGPWHRFAELSLVPDGDDHGEISFDPVLNQVSGLEPYDWVRRLREPSYRSARRSRS